MKLYAVLSHDLRGQGSKSQLQLAHSQHAEALIHAQANRTRLEEGSSRMMF